MPVNDTCLTGAIGEQLFASHFLENRIFFSQPVYDLWGADYVVEWQGALHKVNVKTMYKKQKEKSSFYQVNLTCGNLNKRRYDLNKITYFGIVNIFYKRIWMVPNSESIQKSLVYFGPLESRRRLNVNSFDWEKYRIR